MTVSRHALDLESQARRAVTEAFSERKFPEHLIFPGLEFRNRGVGWTSESQRVATSHLCDFSSVNFQFTKLLR